MRKLVDMGADKSSLNDKFENAAHFLDDREVQTVTAALALAKADIHATEHGEMPGTPMLRAVVCNKPVVLQALLEIESDIRWNRAYKIPTAGSILHNLTSYAFKLCHFDVL
jgi:hypothetical protein